MPSITWDDAVATGYVRAVFVLLLFVFVIGIVRQCLTVPVPTAFIPTIKLPFLIVQLLSNTAELLHRNKAQYGGLYRIRMPGTTVHVVAHADAIRHVLRDPYKCFTAFLTTRMFEQIGDLAPGALNPELEAKLFSIITKTFSSRDTHQITDTYNQLFLRQLKVYETSSVEDRISLTDFVSRSVYNAVSLAFFGPHFPLDTFDDFSEVDYSLLRILAVSWAAPPGARRAQARLKKRYGVLLEQVGPSFDDNYKGLEIAKILHDSNLSVSDQEGILLVIMMAMLAALMRASLWFMAHLLSDLSTQNQLREEIDGVISSEFGSLDALLTAHPKRINPETFPFLHAVLKEVLRLYTLATFVRIAHRDTTLVLGENTSVPISAGDYVVGEGFSVNLCEQEFEDPYAFRPERYLENKDGSPISPNPLSPFGAGIHVCKGREFAQHAIKLFVIVCLRLYTLQGEDASGVSVEGKPPRNAHACPTPVYVLEPTFIRVQKRSVEPTV